MFNYKEVVQCGGCDKIFDGRVPHICNRCGCEIYDPKDLFFSGDEYDSKEIVDTFLCKYRLTGGKKIVAKRTFFGWKIRNTECI